MNKISISLFRIPVSKRFKVNKLLSIVLCALIIGVFLASFFLFNQNDFLSFLNWSISLLILTIPSRRLVKKLVPFSGDSGFIYSMVFSWIGLGFLTWFLAHLGLEVFSTIFIRILVISALLLNILANLKFPKSSHKALSLSITSTSRKNYTLNQTLMTAFIFLTTLSLGIYFRTLKPEIYGLEKFMDYGFMMSMWREDSLPAKDMWLAGNSINYYYFGQYLFTFLAKLTGIPPKISYNLSMATSFSITFTTAYSLVRDIILYKNKQDKNSRTSIAYFTGLLAAGLLCLAGNSHAFFYKEDSLGYNLVKYLKRFGANTGNISNFYFSDSTRFIGHNPDTNDKTIHEFPLYSYVVGDLHAHMINLSFVLLFLTILFAFFIYLRKTKTLSKKSVLTYCLTLSFLLSIFSMTNYWDFAIYFVVSFITITAALLAREKNDWMNLLLFFVQTIAYFIPFLLSFENPILKLCLYMLALILAYFIYNYTQSTLTLSGFYLSLIFTISHLFSLQMNLNMTQMPKVFKLVQNNSSFYQLFILWAFHAGVGIIYIIYMFWTQRNRLKNNLKNQNIAQALANLSSENLFIFILIACGLGLIILPEIIYLKDIYEVNFARANTMFKFTYQSFALLSLGIAYFLGELILKLLPPKISTNYDCEVTFGFETYPRSNTNSGFGTGPCSEEDLAYKAGSVCTTSAADEYEEWNFRYMVPAIACLLSMIIPFSYTSSITDWFDFNKDKSARSLDGSRYLGELGIEDITGNYYSLQNRLDLIDFLNEHEQSSVNILEAYGNSYSDYGSISAYTGLPTVLGWETHEWLWRTSSFEDSSYQNLIAPLQAEINTFYTAGDKSQQLEFIEEHNIKYIIVAELERIKFPDIDEQSLQSLGVKIYSGGHNYIIKVK